MAVLRVTDEPKGGLEGLKRGSLKNNPVSLRSMELLIRVKLGKVSSHGTVFGSIVLTFPLWSVEGFPRGDLGYARYNRSSVKKATTDYIIPSWLCGSGNGRWQKSLLSFIVTFITKKNQRVFECDNDRSIFWKRLT